MFVASMIQWIVMGAPSGSDEPEPSSITQAVEPSSAITFAFVVPKLQTTRAAQIGGALNAATVIVKLHEFELPVLSVALQRTVVAPTGNVPPPGGAQLNEPIPHGS